MSRGPGHLNGSVLVLLQSLAFTKGFAGFGDFTSAKRVRSKHTFVSSNVLPILELHLCHTENSDEMLLYIRHDIGRMIYSFKNQNLALPSIQFLKCLHRSLKSLENLWVK